MRSDEKHPADGLLNRLALRRELTAAEQGQKRDEFAALLADMTCLDSDNRFGTHVPQQKEKEYAR